MNAKNVTTSASNAIETPVTTAPVSAEAAPTRKPQTSVPFYIAFSIHGTDAWLSAAIRTNNFQLLEVEETQKENSTIKRVNRTFVIGQKIVINDEMFTIARSRRDDFDPVAGIKLHSARLLTPAGSPTADVKKVHATIAELLTRGWKIVDYKGWRDAHGSENTPITGV